MEAQLRLLQGGAAPTAQRAAYRRTTERLIRLRDMLVNGNITAYHYAAAVSGVLKLR